MEAAEFLCQLGGGRMTLVQHTIAPEAAKTLLKEKVGAPGLLSVAQTARQPRRRNAIADRLVPLTSGLRRATRLDDVQRLPGMSRLRAVKVVPRSDQAGPNPTVAYALLLGSNWARPRLSPYPCASTMFSAALTPI
ncbi:hypothetical protein JX266_004567 [Neoarthrinium moseri]|nr:hypothetical protein JX266_004567 [Neoarthrinium moseri]